MMARDKDGGVVHAVNSERVDPQSEAESYEDEEFDEDEEADEDDELTEDDEDEEAA